MYSLKSSELEEKEKCEEVKTSMLTENKVTRLFNCFKWCILFYRVVNTTKPLDPDDSEGVVQPMNIATTFTAEEFMESIQVPCQPRQHYPGSGLQFA